MQGLVLTTGRGCSAVLSAEWRQPKSPNPGSSGTAFLFLLNSGIPLPNPGALATLCQAKHSSLTCHKRYYFSGFHPSSQVSLLQTRTCTALRGQTGHVVRSRSQRGGTQAISWIWSIREQEQEAEERAL